MTKGCRRDQESCETRRKSASQAGKVVSKKSGTSSRSDQGTSPKVANSVEDFAATLGGLSVDRAKTFYDEGIKSASDFKTWTEKRTPCLERNRPSYHKEIKKSFGISLQVIFLVPCISVKTCYNKSHQRCFESHILQKVAVLRSPQMCQNWLLMDEK